MSDGDHPKNGISLAKRKTTFGFLIFVNILRNMGGSSLTIGLPDFILELAGTLTLYGVTIGVFQFVQTFFQIPNATLSDRIGRKKVIAIGFSIYIIGLFLSGFAQTITQLIIFRAIQGAGAFSSVIFATVTDLYDKTERTKAISMYSISLTIGYILGNIVGGIASDFIGVRSLFFWAAGLNAIAFLVLMIILPETHPRVDRAQPIPEEIEPPTSNLKDIWTLPFIFGLFMHGLRQFVFGGYITYQIWNYRNLFGLTGIQTSLILIPLTFSYILGLIMAPHIEKKWKYFPIMMGSSSVLGVLLMLIGWIDSFWMYFAINVIFVIFLAIQDPINTAFITNLLSDEHRGFGTGVIQSVGFMMAALGQMGISALGDWVGFNLTHFITGIMWMIVVITIFYINRRISSSTK